jgi:hypothetical protein
MKYAEVNWIVVVIFAIGIISQIVEAVRKKKVEEEPLPGWDEIPHSPPSSSRGERDPEIGDLLESLGIPRTTRETPSPEIAEEQKEPPRPLLNEEEDRFSEGPAFEFPKNSPEAAYDSPFPGLSATTSEEPSIGSTDFENEIQEEMRSPLTSSETHFQVIDRKRSSGFSRQKLRSPEALREAFILREILDAPRGLSPYSW